MASNSRGNTVFHENSSNKETRPDLKGQKRSPPTAVGSAAARLMNAPSALPARKAVGSVAPRVTTVLSDPQSHLSTLLQRLQMLPKLTRSLQQAHIQAQACAGEANPHISTSLNVFNKGLALEGLEVDVTR